MTTNQKNNQADPGTVFAFFTEIGIIDQLSQAMLAKCLPDGVHPSHFAIVNHLARVGEGAGPAQIACAMQVTKTTMSHSLKVLEDRGLIRIKPSPEDGRAKQVFLTDTGHKFRQQAIPAAQTRFGDVLSSEHIALMKRIHGDLETLRRHLDDNR